jgi:hypothetical protein
MCPEDVIASYENPNWVSGGCGEQWCQNYKFCLISIKVWNPQFFFLICSS